jgi:integrase
VKKDLPEGKNEKNGPLEVIKVGNVSVPIYRHTNIIPKRDEAGKIIYGPPDANGNQRALIKYQSDIYMLAYYTGSKRVRQKFSDLEEARREANLAAVKIGNGELEALKLKGHDRTDYIRAMQKLREWKPEANLNFAVSDYVAAVTRLPENTSLKEAVDFYVKRHPTGLPSKTVQDVVDELVDAKEKAGRSEIYTKELRRRLGHFADAFSVRISMVSGKHIEDFIRHPRLVGQKKDAKVSRVLSGRTQNNYRQLINTLFRFAVKRGYLPRDHDEMSAVELAENDGGEIEVFTPVELRKLFNACLTPVQERRKWRDREAMIPYLAIAAFCGLRAAEIARLDWSEVHLTGAEHFIEVKASKAKTASRRTVPISENCARWLAPFARETGPVCPFERPDKQCFYYLGPAAGLKWKHNGLRHSFISYRLAQIKNVHQVSLEAGNSPQMVFQHYRQLVSETQATEWFGIVPPKDWKNIAPMPAEIHPDDAGASDAEAKA